MKPRRLLRDCVTTPKENQRLNALSMSSSENKREIKGLSTTNVELETPIHKKENMIINGFLVQRKIMTAIVIEHKPTNKSFLLPTRSAIMPIGSVRMAELSAIIMKTYPKVDPLNPSEVK